MYVEKDIIPEPGSKRAQLVSYFEGQVAGAQENIDRFVTEMKTSPVQALDWGDKVFESVASKDVGDMMLYMLKHYSELDDIKKSMQSRMRDKARYINNKSTSTSSNFLKECMLAQVVRALEHLEYFV